MKNKKLTTERVSVNNQGVNKVITIPVERNRDGYHNITINMDFNLPLGVVKVSKEDGR